MILADGMSTDSWLQIITWLMAAGAALAAFVLRYAVQIASNVATIKTKIEHFDGHVTECEADRKNIWQAITDLKLHDAEQKAGTS